MKAKLLKKLRRRYYIEELSGGYRLMDGEDIELMPITIWSTDLKEVLNIRRRYILESARSQRYKKTKRTIYGKGY